MKKIFGNVDLEDRGEEGLVMSEQRDKSWPSVRDGRELFLHHSSGVPASE